MKRIYVAGHHGMVGSALIRQLESSGNRLVTATRAELDLLNQSEVACFFKDQNIDEVYLAAARVGGIKANSTYEAEFIYQNLMIQCNVIQAAHTVGVGKLLFLGSSCVYPKFAPQPMKEEHLLSGVLESTNEAYAVAKIAGLKMCESYMKQYGRDYRSVMPTNLYGSHDNFHPDGSHVIPGLLRRMHEAKEGGENEFVAWGSGTAKREFLHVDDMARACLLIMSLSSSAYKKLTQPKIRHINIGSGDEYSIKELLQLVAKVVGYGGNLSFNSDEPDGTPRKILDVSKLSGLGWKAEIPLEQGLRDTYSWFLKHHDSARM